MRDDDAIGQIMFDYAERIDRGDFAGVGQLFTHGRIVLNPDDPDQDVVGANAVEAFYRSAVKVYPDGTPRTHHLTTNVVIRPGDNVDTASSRSVFTVFQQTAELPLQPIITGRYADTFARIESTWWFATRQMTVSLIGDLSHHLEFDLPG